MPNWVSNVVYVEAPSKEKLEGFMGFVKSDKSVFDFNKIIPQDVNDPKYQCDPKVACIEPHDDAPNFNWYGWNADHWGTKWNACHHRDVEFQSDDFVVFRFDTAWSFPEPVLEALKEKFPDFTIYADWMDEFDDQWHEWGLPE